MKKYTEFIDIGINENLRNFDKLDKKYFNANFTRIEQTGVNKNNSGEISIDSGDFNKASLFRKSFNLIEDLHSYTNIYITLNYKGNVLFNFALYVDRPSYRFGPSKIGYTSIDDDKHIAALAIIVFDKNTKKAIEFINKKLFSSNRKEIDYNKYFDRIDNLVQNKTIEEMFPNMSTKFSTNIERYLYRSENHFSRISNSEYVIDRKKKEKSSKDIEKQKINTNLLKYVENYINFRIESFKRKNSEQLEKRRINLEYMFRNRIQKNTNPTKYVFGIKKSLFLDIYSNEIFNNDFLLLFKDLIDLKNDIHEKLSKLNGCIKVENSISNDNESKVYHFDSNLFNDLDYKSLKQYKTSSNFNL